MQQFSICAAEGANTGGFDCDPVRGLPVQIVPGSASFSPSEYATNASFEAAFLGRLNLAAGSTEKLFPFPAIQGNTAKTTAAKFGTLGYGLQVKLLRSKQGYEFDVIAGSALEKKLIKFDRLSIPIFIFDDTSRIWGITDRTGNFTGAKYLLSVEPKDFEDAANAKTTKITISIIDTRDFVENAKYADTTFNSSDIKGLNDAVLFTTIANASNVYHIGAKILGSSVNSFINVHDTYATALASGALWAAKTAAGALTITSVANDAANGGWVVTFDSTAYTALTAGTAITVSLVSPTALDAANVTGIESVPLQVVK
jgi:hypothetical protein